MFDEDVMHDIYCAALKLMFDEKFKWSFRDAAIIEASRHTYAGEALIQIADELELRDDVERYSDVHKEVYGYRPESEDMINFRKMPAVQRMLELNLLYGQIEKEE